MLPLLCLLDDSHVTVRTKGVMALRWESVCGMGVWGHYVGSRA